MRYCILAVLCLALQVGNLFAQTAGLQPIAIGAQVPRVALQLLNSNTTGATLVSYKGKLLILNFWSTYCVSCVHHIAAIDSLLTLYGDKIAVVGVNSVTNLENESRITSFIKGYKKRISGGFTMPCAVNDSVLYQLFPHTTLGYYVWIDSNGKYLGGTDVEELTPANITAAYAGLPLQLKLQQPLAMYNEALPLTGQLDTNVQIVHTGAFVLTGYANSLSQLNGYSETGSGTAKLFAINATLKALLRQAYGRAEYMSDNLIEVRLRNTTKENVDTLNSKLQQRYCYERVGHAGNDSLLLVHMQQDIEKVFGLKGYYQQKQVNCLVLIANKDLPVKHSAGESEGNSLHEQVSDNRVITNQRLSVLTERLSQLPMPPVLDETGIDYNIDLQLPNNLTDIPALQQALATQGLLLTQQEKQIEYFIITEK